jgi:membrane protein required for colicin V production
VSTPAILDLALLAVVVLSSLVGVWRGFLREAMSLVVWVAALWLAWRFGSWLAPQLADLIENPVLRLWAARGLLLAGTVLAGGIVTLLVGQLLHATGLGPTDRAVGLVFGFARGLVLAALGLIGAQLAGFDAEPWWRESKLIPYAAPVTDALRDAAQRGMQRLQVAPASPSPFAGEDGIRT